VGQRLPLMQVNEALLSLALRSHGPDVDPAAIIEALCKEKPA
jgi:hypothetical protein